VNHTLSQVARTSSYTKSISQSRNRDRSHISPALGGYGFPYGGTYSNCYSISTSLTGRIHQCIRPRKPFLTQRLICQHGSSNGSDCAKSAERSGAGTMGR